MKRELKKCFGIKNLIYRLRNEKILEESWDTHFDLKISRAILSDYEAKVIIQSFEDSGVCFNDINLQEIEELISEIKYLLKADEATREAFIRKVLCLEMKAKVARSWISAAKKCYFRQVKGNAELVQAIIMRMAIK